MIRDEREDVARLFACLVRALGAQNPDRPRTTFQVSELYQSILPYRANRSALGIDTNQDYEMAVLRLLAGHGGFAVVEPSEVQDALAFEAEQVSPDPTAFREYAGATVHLQPAAVARLLDADHSYAPPAEEPDATESPAPEEAVSAPVFALADTEPPAPRAEPPRVAATEHATRLSAGTAPIACRHCGRTLPLQRAVTYCPFCGRLAHTLTCPGCGTALETGWRYCVDCGEPTAPRSGPGTDR